MAEETGKAVEVWEETRLPWHPALEERLKNNNLTRLDWKTICEVIFPSATEVNSIVMALDYCRARNLDVMKKMTHIVPVYSTAAKGMVDTIWPSIAELRVTATRSGEYAGADRIVFGPMIEREFEGKVYGKKETVKMQFPEWAEITLYRIVKGQRVAFNPPAVYWEETYGIQGKFGESDLPNSMWQKRARGQLAKCCEAAALRFTFPEEIGNDITAEEMEGQQFYGADNAKVVKDVTKPSSEPPAEAAAAPEPEIITDIEPVPSDEDAPESPVEVVDDKTDDAPEPEPEAQSEQPVKEETPELSRSELYAQLWERAETFSDYDGLAEWDVSITEQVAWICEEFPDSANKLNKFIGAQLTILGAAV